MRLSKRVCLPTAKPYHIYNFFARRYMSSLNEAYIAIGSNVGDRNHAFHMAFQNLRDLGSICQTSFLYETPAQYFEAQPKFLNAVCKIETRLDPHELLRSLKQLEDTIGREKNFRNGPRLIDLDILLYGNMIINTPSLQIPHPRIQERLFVLRPLCDISPSLVHPIINKSMQQLLDVLIEQNTSSTDPIQKVIPFLRRNGETLIISTMKGNKISIQLQIMGILNVTPDSFSDGGLFNSKEKAIQQAKKLLEDGATIIDIGGASSRPNALYISEEEELSRTVPIIRLLREVGITSLISIDTTRASVAKACIENGADIINDISGGKGDPNMIPVASDLGVPMIFMHMRGDATTMTSLINYSNVVEDVANELNTQLTLADSLLPRWLQLVDPGIGFAKNTEQNIALLKPANLLALKQLVGDRPMLVGLSRKRFLNTLTNISPNSKGEEIADRDQATAGACNVCVLGNVEILRVHNVRSVRQTCEVFKKIIEI